MSHRPLTKHTIVIWAEENLNAAEISFLAQQAETGEAYCSKHEVQHVSDPEADPDWDGTEFFGGVEESDA